LLLFVQFIYNNTIYTTIKKILFFVNYRYNSTVLGDTIGKYTETESTKILISEFK